MEKTIEERTDRSPGDSYEEIIARDIVPAPDFYQEGPTPDVGTEPIAASRYFDPTFLQQELDHVFSRVWQWTCREEDIPEPGDHVVFDVGSYSWIVVRTETGDIKALTNTCPHRGRQIVEQDGNQTRFRCPYHGLQWELDGSLKHNPFGWDTPQWEACGANLPEARVAIWGRFVFMKTPRRSKRSWRPSRSTLSATIWPAATKPLTSSRKSAPTGKPPVKRLWKAITWWALTRRH